MNLTVETFEPTKERTSKWPGSEFRKVSNAMFRPLRDTLSMAPPTDEELLDQFAVEFENMQAQPPISVQIDTLTAWSILASVQLALRHPLHIGATAECSRQFAQHLERFIATTPALKEVARRGWLPEHDAQPSQPQPTRH